MSLTAAPPDLKVTTGVLIISLAVIVKVTTLPTPATVLLALLEAILTALTVGAVVSFTGTTAILSMKIVPAATPVEPSTFVGLNLTCCIVPVQLAAAVAVFMSK